MKATDHELTAAAVGELLQDHGPQPRHTSVTNTWAVILAGGEGLAID